MTTKIHALVDALGNPANLMLTAGQIHDLACAQDLIENADPEALIADKAYDADLLIDSLAEREIAPVPVVIDYETFCKIHDCHDRQGLTIAQTARALGLHPKTVATWVARSRFEPRRSRPRSSVLDPFKPRIIRLLDTHPYSAQQIFQRLREEGYGGGVTILRDYVRRIRPTKRPVYLKLHFAPGECAQVDWGAYGTVAVGNTHQPGFSFFVMVLAFSRQMFVEFTVSQTMEHFLACHEHAFTALGGVPSKIMVDNLKSAVLQRLTGAAPGVQSALSRLCPPPRLCDRSLQCRPRQREGARKVGCGLRQKEFPITCRNSWCAAA